MNSTKIKDRENTKKDVNAQTNKQESGAQEQSKTQIVSISLIDRLNEDANIRREKLGWPKCVTLPDDPIECAKLNDFQWLDYFDSCCQIINTDAGLYYRVYDNVYYTELNEREIYGLVYTVLQDKLDMLGSVKRIKDLVLIIKMRLGASDIYENLPFKSEICFRAHTYDMFKNRHSSKQKINRNYMGFSDGVLDCNNWKFYSFDQISEWKNSIVVRHLPFSYYCDTTVEGESSKTNSNTPVADNFLEDITGGDQELIARIYEMIGYIISPHQNAKCFFLLQGVPNSGKSVLGRFLEGFFPSYCVTSLDIDRLGGQYLPASFSCSLLNLSMDLPDGRLSKKSVATLKMLTGNDLITHEVKYKDAKPYRGQCKFLFSINGKLKMPYFDDAFLERIVCIPFRYSVAKEKQNPYVLDMLESERQAITMKALNYYSRFLQNNRQFSGNYKPEIEYKLSLNETIELFVQRECGFNQNSWSYTDELYEGYRVFCHKMGIRSVDTKEGFGQRLACMYQGVIVSDRKNTSVGGVNKNARGFRGIELCRAPIVHRA